MTAMELLIPNWADLAMWAGVLIAALAFIGVGRLLSAGRAAPEAALIAGWGGACLLLTLWGIATAASLRWPAAIIVLIGLCGLAAPRFRLEAPAWRGMLRMGVVALPLLGDHGERSAEPPRHLPQPAAQRRLSLRSRGLSGR